MSEILRFSNQSISCEENKTGDIVRLNGDRFVDGLSYVPITLNKYGVIETKSVRKMANNFIDLQQFGVISRKLRLGSAAILDEHSTSTYIEAINEKENGLFLKIRLGESSLPNEVKNINVLTGICLFNTVGAQVETVDRTFSLTNPYEEISQKALRIKIKNQLTLYEVETITRLTQAINMITSGQDNIDNIFVHIPRVEYYTYILDGYEKGYITSSDALRWFDEVDNRAERVFSLLSRRLEKRTIVSVISPLAPIEEYLKQTIENGEIPKIGKAVKILRQSEGLIAEATSLVSLNAFAELNYISYQSAVLTSGYTGRWGPDVVGVIIDNPSEEAIMINATRLSRNIGGLDESFNMVGMYIHPKVLIDAPKGSLERQLYFYQDEVDLATVRNVLKIYKDLENL